MNGDRWVGPAVRAVARRPALWPAAVAAVLRLAAPGWWRRWPPVPAPPAAYWRFRSETANGGEEALSPEEVVAYLQWCRRSAPGRG